MCSRSRAGTKTNASYRLPTRAFRVVRTELVQYQKQQLMDDVYQIFLWIVLVSCSGGAFVFLVDAIWWLIRRVLTNATKTRSTRGS